METIVLVWHVEDDPLWAPGVPITHKTVFKSKCEPCLLCGTFGACSSSATTATPQGFDMSLLWVPRRHEALASTVSEGTLTQCGPINGVLCTGNSSEFDDLHGEHLSTSTSYPRRGPESESLSYCTRSNIPPSDPTSSTPTSPTTGALQVECRIPSNLGFSRRADFSHHELERRRACPSIKTSAGGPADIP